VDPDHVGPHPDSDPAKRIGAGLDLNVVEKI
jgi:hypothetical protein